jgi:hypothetical protein
MSIKEQFEQTEKLYHFTKFDTALKILESNRLRFGRLDNMNDIHENDKIEFVGANNQQINEFPSEVLDALHDEIYKYRQISLTTEGQPGDNLGFNLHQMWGIYADKGEGVCLVFDKKELEKSHDMKNINLGRVNYDDTKKLESFFISDSKNPEEVLDEIKKHIPDIYFHKRKEWEHEQEYRLIKRCPNAAKEEYLLLGHALKFIILSSKLRNIDEVRYFENIDNIKRQAEKIEKARKIGKAGKVPVLVYGNGLFDYALCTEDGKKEVWNSKDGYDILVIGKNCKLAL